MLTKNYDKGISHCSSSGAREKLFANLNEYIKKYINTFDPRYPLYVTSMDILNFNVKNFLNSFQGKALYAVKCNPDENVLKCLVNAGVNSFDVASLSEIKLVKSVHPSPDLYFMHPVKSPEDIREAYFNYGIRNFVLDCEEELYKILRETELAQDLNLHVRIALPKNEDALIDFSVKFGVSKENAVSLLKKCGAVSKSLGLSFHVGSQTTDVKYYMQAIDTVSEILNLSKVKIDNINIGGGFPAYYMDHQEYYDGERWMSEFIKCLKKHNLDHVDLLSEPGRVLVAESTTLVTRVELKKDHMLYINDGVYGGLFDAAPWVKTKYPTWCYSKNSKLESKLKNYRIAGPTCDSVDILEGNYALPDNIDSGDWIMFQSVGAYSQIFRSNFNGFGYSENVIF